MYLTNASTNTKVEQPRIIYLTTEADSDYDSVCWCQDRISDDDTKYIREDVVKEELARREQEVREGVAREILTIIIRGSFLDNHGKFSKEMILGTLIKEFDL